MILDEPIHENKDITFLFDPGFISKSLIRKAEDVTEDESVDSRSFEGMANVRVIDRIGDLIDPQAFSESIDEYMLNPVLRFNHEEGSLIGSITEIRIQDDGLWVKGEIGEWALAEDKWKQMQSGHLKALSIMGRVDEWEEKQTPDGQWFWYITKFYLIEISVVEIPMNQLSLFEVKSAHRLTKNRDAYLSVHAQLKAFLLKNYAKRLPKVTKKNTKKSSEEKVPVETPKEEVVEAPKEEVVETPEEKVETPSEEEVKEEATEEEVKEEKSSETLETTQKGEGDDDEDDEEAIKTIAQFIKEFADATITRLDASDLRLSALEKAVNMEDEEEEEEEEKAVDDGKIPEEKASDDEEEDEDEKSVTTLDNILEKFSIMMDSKLKAFELQIETAEPVVVEKMDLKQTFRKTVNQHVNNTPEVKDTVKTLSLAIRARMNQ